MVETRKCPKCNGDMEKGNLMDETYLSSAPQKWAKHATGFMGVGSKDTKKITSYRCKNCGFLENFAP
jgi:predicted nucleic-acid-binding Zn-ribbon protein